MPSRLLFGARDRELAWSFRLCSGTLKAGMLAALAIARLRTPQLIDDMIPLLIVGRFAIKRDAASIAILSNVLFSTDLVR